jgi:hypothetical protein
VKLVFSFLLFMRAEANTACTILYMCRAPERLTALGARFPSVSTTIMDQKVQLIKPFNLRELYRTWQNRKWRAPPS